MPARTPGVATDMTTVGIIGAGHIGSALAEGLVGRGYDVVISNSRGPETLAGSSPARANARAATPAEAAEAADWAIVTVPLKAIDDIPAAPLAGKIVLDTNNYYWERDGHIVALDDKQTTTTQMVQDHLAGARVVKAFNHIPAAAILTDGAPAAPRSPRSRSRATMRMPRPSRPPSTTSSASTPSTSDRSPRAGASSATSPPTSSARTPTSCARTWPARRAEHVLSARRSRPRCRRSRPSAAALAA
jgi:hypothetical protein